MDTEVKDEIDRYMDDCLNDIGKGTLESIANVINKLDNHPKPKNVITSFRDAINKRIAKYENEIQKTCDQNISLFDDTTQLANFAEAFLALKQAIEKNDEDINNSVKEVERVCGTLLQNQRMLCNVNSCIESVSICIPVFKQLLNIKNDLDNKRYYQALRGLERLEKDLLPNMKPFYIYENLAKYVPSYRKLIKEASDCEVTDFLQRIRSSSRTLGAQILGHSPQQKSDKTYNSPRKPSVFGQPDENVTSLEAQLQDLDDIAQNYQLQLTPYDSSRGVGENGLLDELHWSEIADFSALYRCIHIHTVLNEQESYITNFCNQRMKQISLLFTNLRPGETDLLFEELVGFFVVEDHLRHTLPGVKSLYEARLDVAWESACVRLTDYLSGKMRECSQPDHIIALKNSLSLFIERIRNFGYPCGQLYDFIGVMRVNYNSLLETEMEQRLRDLLEMDNYTAIDLSADEPESPVLQNYLDLTAERNSPQVASGPLPYSMMVPNLYNEMCRFIDQIYKFSKLSEISWSDLDDAISRSVMNVMSVHLPQQMTHVLTSKNVSFMHLAQLLVNVDHFQEMLTLLDTYILRRVQPGILKLSSAQLTPVETVWRKKTRKNVSSSNNWNLVMHSLSRTTALMSLDAPAKSRLLQGNLCNDMNQKIEDMFQKRLDIAVGEMFEHSAYSAFNESNLREPTEPSLHVTGIINYLNVFFASYTHLPEKVVSLSYVNICNLLNKHLMDVLLRDASIAVVSPPLLVQLKLDVEECIKFALSSTANKPQHLKMHFSGLKQLLNIALDDSWTKFVARRGQVMTPNDPFYHVRPIDCYSLFMRMYPSEKSTINPFQSAQKREKIEANKRTAQQLRKLL